MFRTNLIEDPSDILSLAIINTLKHYNKYNYTKEEQYIIECLKEDSIRWSIEDEGSELSIGLEWFGHTKANFMFAGNKLKMSHVKFALKFLACDCCHVDLKTFMRKYDDEVFITTLNTNNTSNHGKIYVNFYITTT